MNKPAVPPALHELERDVMEVVWERARASVREVMDALNATGERRRAYTTYMTIMARLARKHLLERERSGKTDYYRPVYTRERYNDLCAQAAVESVLDEFGGVAVAHMARQMAHLDPDRRRALEGLADAD
ncbi:MAG TPA: BlaI/MecI/CopY family transcriptional regulator [Solirubrobacteraceae bacterium]|nr:BlaI/MecI/CopY family transcriptional regulator [Solirubrobacteraceae bacterium]